jgi:hypothetical protein
MSERKCPSSSVQIPAAEWWLLSKNWRRPKDVDSGLTITIEMNIYLYILCIRHSYFCWKWKWFIFGHPWLREQPHKFITASDWTLNDDQGWVLVWLVTGRMCNVQMDDFGNGHDLCLVPITCKTGNWISYFPLALSVERLWFYASR